MTQNIPLAIILGVIASGCFALGATFQHDGIGHSVSDGAEGNMLTLRRMTALLRNKRWLGGTVLIGLGALMHLAGVNMAPVTVVQPVGILAVPFAVMLAARKNHTRPTRGMIVSIVMAVAGIVGFTVLSASNAATETAIHMPSIWVAYFALWAISLIFAGFGLRGPVGMRCLAWACSGAIIYGLATAMMKTTLEHFHQGAGWGLDFWLSLVAMIACYALGGWIIQQAYASGPAEIVVGCMTVVDPLVAVIFGITVLGEGRNINALTAVGMAAMAVLASAGVFLLSKYHPDAAKAYEAEAAPVQEGTHP